MRVHRSRDAISEETRELGHHGGPATVGGYCPQTRTNPLGHRILVGPFVGAKRGMCGIPLSQQPLGEGSGSPQDKQSCVTGGKCAFVWSV